MQIDTSVALTDLNRAKDFLKITGNSEDSIIMDLVNASSAFAERYTGRKLRKATVTEYYDGDGTNQIILRQYPVVSLTSLNDDVNRNFASDSLISANDMMVDKASGAIRVWGGKPAFLKGRGNIKAVYVAGYDVDTCPHDLRLAIHMTISTLYKNAYQFQRLGIQSETKGDLTTQTRDEDLPKQVKMILDNYRSIGSGEGFAFS